jgi:endo-1,4-beta-xylanase
MRPIHVVWVFSTLASACGSSGLSETPDGSDDVGVSGSSSGSSTGGVSGADAGKSSSSGVAPGSGSSSSGAALDAGKSSSSGSARDAAMDSSDGSRASSSSSSSSSGAALDAATDSSSEGGSTSSSSSGDGGTGASTKFVGNISTSGAIRSDFATYWNQFTPENEGKWGDVEPTQGTFNWAPLDAEYQYTQAHGIIFKHHNFVWGQQQPSWTSGLTTSNGPSTLQGWMKAVCTRYPNVKLIDVVNEPTHNQPPYMNAIGGAGASGFDWVVNAFKWARAACPSATLLVNDYNTIEYQADHNNFITLVKAIKAAGAPVDAVGAQGHAAFNFPAATVQAFIDDLAKQTGLPVYITEFDINVASDTTQATIMQNLFTMFWNDANVHGITLWGYIEGATWEPNTGLMTSSGTMRPAMTWLETFLKSH